MSLLHPRPHPPTPYTVLQVDNRLAALAANRRAAELTGDRERLTVVNHHIDALLEKRRELAQEDRP